MTLLRRLPRALRVACLSGLTFARLTRPLLTLLAWFARLLTFPRLARSRFVSWLGPAFTGRTFFRPGLAIRTLALLARFAARLPTFAVQLRWL